MEDKDLELMASLQGEYPELDQLWREHQELEVTLEAMNERIYLTPEEQVERKRLQKLKLAGRDRIEAILAGHRSLG